MLTETTGRPLSRIVVSDAEFVDQLARGTGISIEFARMFLELFTAGRACEFAETDPTLGRLIGHATGTPLSTL